MNSPAEAGDAPHLLIVEAPYYADIGSDLLTGARRALDAAAVSYEVVRVPGALEIPTVIAFADASDRYDAFVALGCVIRGETSHYDIVAGESARGLQKLGVERGCPIGNGILTVENQEQARVRAAPDGKNKGGEAAHAALALLALAERFLVDRAE